MRQTLHATKPVKKQIYSRKPQYRLLGSAGTSVPLFLEYHPIFYLVKFPVSVPATILKEIIQTDHNYYEYSGRSIDEDLPFAVQRGEEGLQVDVLPYP